MTVCVCVCVCARVRRHAELKEAASESAHRRRIEELRNGAINAIAEAVEGGSNGQQRGAGADKQGTAAQAWRLRSVAEVQEAEQELYDELRETQAKNAAVLDRLTALKKAMAGTELQHNRELAGKVRHLVGQHARAAWDSPRERS